MTAVTVKPELLKWAIDRSGKTVDDLAESFAKIEQWLAGEKQPTFRQLQDFAKKTMTPFGSLLLDKPPVEDIGIPDFRTLGDTPIDRPSPNLIDTIDESRRRQAFVRDQRLEDGWESLPFVASASPRVSTSSLAQRMRQQLQLTPEWAESLPSWEDALNRLRRAAEEIGILVFSNAVVGLNNHRPLDPEDFRGFVICDPIAPAIFLNDADSKSARMFTLAHELVHIWLGRDALVNLINLLPAHNETERYCNVVAAEFLVPAYKLTARWDEVAAETDRFYRIARWFKVSPVVAARRALELGLIGEEQFFLFYHADRAAFLKRKAEQRKKPGGNFYSTQAVRLGRPFSSAIARAVREGSLSYREAHRLTGMKGETFDKFADLILKRARNERQ